MKYFRTTLYIAAFTTANLIFGALGTHNVAAQTIVKAPTQNAETKGEVDLLLEDYKKLNQSVLRRCIENCSDSPAPDGPQYTGGQSVERVMPEYPAIAREARVTGNVVVLILIDEEGKVIAAQSVSGHPLLQAAAVNAARQSTFTPTQVDGEAVKVLATITYRFVIQ